MQVKLSFHYRTFSSTILLTALVVATVSSLAGSIASMLNAKFDSAFVFGILGVLVFVVLVYYWRSINEKWEIDGRFIKYYRSNGEIKSFTFDEIEEIEIDNARSSVYGKFIKIRINHNTYNIYPTICNNQDFLDLLRSNALRRK